MTKTCTWMLAGLLSVAVVAMAQDDESSDDVLDQMQGQMRDAPATQPAEDEQPATEEGSEALDDVEQSMQPSPAIEPSGRGPESQQRPAPSIGLNIDPSVLGVAPGQEPPKLRREGDFVISRRGRLQPSPSGNHMLFVFESDDQSMQDPPMVLVPCQTLESMEEQVRRRGDRVVFILSGQVLQYRGVNFLLPTMMKLDIDRGNLE